MALMALARLRAASSAASWPPGLLVMLQHQQQRSIRLFEVFSKQGKQERAEQLKKEMNQGYFDDFRQLRKTEGRLFDAPGKLIAAQAARRFPDTQVELADGSRQIFPGDLLQGSRAALLTAGFRAGSEAMLDSWSTPFAARFGSHQDVRWLDLAIIESVVMRMWPFRSMILGSAAQSPQHEGVLSPQHAFHFGQAEAMVQAARMSNRLTGYVYLMDSRGRLRWQAAGPAQEAEVETMLKLTEQLLAEPGP